MGQQASSYFNEGDGFKSVFNRSDEWIKLWTQSIQDVCNKINIFDLFTNGSERVYTRFCMLQVVGGGAVPLFAFRSSCCKGDFLAKDYC